MTNDSVRALLPEKFQKIFEIWPREAVGESLCLLYVAMIAPVHALHILVAPTTATKPGGKPPAFPKTFAGILRSALAEGRPFAPGTVAYEHGDRAWDRASAERAGRQSVAAAAEPEPIRLRVSGKLRHWDAAVRRRWKGEWRATGRRASAGPGGVSCADRCGTPGWSGSKGSTSSRPTRRCCARVAKPFAAGLDVEQELAAFWQTVVSGPIGKLLCRAAYDDPQSVGVSAQVARRLGESEARRLAVVATAVCRA